MACKINLFDLDLSIVKKIKLKLTARLMRNRKYFLDLNDLQFKQVRLTWPKKLLNILFFFAGTVAIAIIYATIFESLFGSPKEAILHQLIDNL